jgi:hypothetical protein
MEEATENTIIRMRMLGGGDEASEGCVSMSSQGSGGAAHLEGSEVQKIRRMEDVRAHSLSGSELLNRSTAAFRRIMSISVYCFRCPKLQACFCCVISACGSYRSLANKTTALHVPGLVTT